MTTPEYPAHPSYLTTRSEILAWLHAAHALKQFPPAKPLRAD